MSTGERWYHTGVRLSPEEYDGLRAPKGHVIVELDYFYDDIKNDGFVLEGVNYDYEKFIPKRGVVKSVSPDVIKDGYSWLTEINIRPGDKVWITPFAGHATAGKSEAGKMANKSAWTPGRYCMAVRHQDIVLSLRDGEYRGQNGFIILDNWYEKIGTDRTAHYIAKVVAPTVPRHADDNRWPLYLTPGDEIITRLVPLTVEYKDVAQIDWCYTKPDAVMAKIQRHGDY